MPLARKDDNPPRMKFDEFIEWAEQQEGRWELHDGVPVRLHDPARGQSERARHVRVKRRIVRSFENALELAGRDGGECEIFTDGMTVRIDDNISYEPDAVVNCGRRVDGDDIIVPDPLIIVEVLSPSTAWKDVGDKLADYFRLPSLAHYLIIDPKNKRIMHHYREGGEIKAEAVNGASLHLDPPGLDLELKELFA